MGPNLMTGVRHTVTDRRSDRMPCSHGAETGAVHLQARNASDGGHQQELKEARKTLSQSLQREHGPATLISGFRPPELGEHTLTCVEAPMWGSLPCQPQDPDSPPSKGK